MNRSALKLYSSAPVWVQNGLVSLYGAHLRWLRHGRVYRDTLRELLESQRLPKEALERLQLERLNAVLANASGDVALYRERDLPSSVASLEGLADIPLIQKADLQRPASEVAAQTGGTPEVIHTGGTTGRALKIYCDRDTLNRNYAFFERFRHWTGTGLGKRNAVFAGRTIVPSDQDGPPYWRRNLATNTMLFSSYHLGPQTLPSYVAALAGFKPALIDSYPSSLDPIARYMVDHDIRTVRPTAVITSSETLHPEVRGRIERAFGCTVYDHYGAAEMAALITQCEHGAYHVNPEFGIVEIVRDGAPVGPGESGEIVATGFINPVMPLIRYATGDEAVASDRPCECGRHFPVIDELRGRMDDVIVTPDGRRVGRLDPIFKAVHSLEETQVVQDASDHIEVQIVTAQAPDPAELEALRFELAARVGPTMRIDIVRVERIPRAASGKLRTVVNKIRT